MADLVGAVLFAVLFPLGMWALFRYSRRPPEVDGDGVVLRYGPAVAVMGWLGLGLGVLMLGAVAVGEMAGEPWFMIALVSAVGSAFGVGGVWFLRAHCSEYVRFSPTGVEGRSGWGARPVSLGWAEIERVRFRPMMGVLVLRSSDGRTVHVSPLLHGSDELVALLERLVRADGVAEAIGAFHQYRAAYGGRAKR